MPILDGTMRLVNVGSTRLYFCGLAVAMFPCFFVCFSLAGTISGRAYVLLRYGWESESKSGLHVIRMKPDILLSNGEHVVGLMFFLVMICCVALTLGLIAISFHLIGRLTALMGRRIQVFAVGTNLSKLSIALHPDPKESRTEMLIAVLIVAGSLALGEMLINGSMMHTLRNYAIFLAAASAGLRLVFAGAPPDLLRGRRIGLSSAERRLNARRAVLKALMRSDTHQ